MCKKRDGQPQFWARVGVVLLVVAAAGFIVASLAPAEPMAAPAALTAFAAVLTAVYQIVKALRGTR